MPPKVVYSLTPLGEGLNRALAPLGEWGQANLDHIVGVRNASSAAATTADPRVPHHEALSTPSARSMGVTPASFRNTLVPGALTDRSEV